MTQLRYAFGTAFAKLDEVGAQSKLLSGRISGAVGDFEQILFPLCLSILLDTYSKHMIESVSSGRA
jgi:hypothetical protein